MEDIRGDIAQQISELCSCQLLPVHITDDKFSCQGSFGQHEDTVVYRAKITSVGLDIDADQLVGLIQNWVQSGVIIEVDQVSLNVDTDCTTQLESLTADACDTGSPTPSENQGSGSQQSSVGLIAAAVIPAIIFIAILIGVTVIIIYCKFKPRKK